MLNTKEKPFDPTKLESVQSISLLVLWLEGFNHWSLSIGSITPTLHYGPWLLFRGQRSKHSYNDAQCFIDWLWGGKCFYRGCLVAYSISVLFSVYKAESVWVHKLCLYKCVPPTSLLIFMNIPFDYVYEQLHSCGHISPFLCAFQFLNK